MPCSVHSTFIGQRLSVILYVAPVIASFLSWFYSTKYGVQYNSTLDICFNCNGVDTWWQ